MDLEKLKLLYIPVLVSFNQRLFTDAAIIFQDGCLRLELWLKTFAEKLGSMKTSEVRCIPKQDDLNPKEEPEDSGLLTPCGSLHNVNDQLKTVNSYLEESKSKEKLLDELRVRL